MRKAKQTAVKLLCCCLCLLFAASICACEDPEFVTGNNNVSIWSYTSAERILRDKLYMNDFRREGRIDIFAVKNEEENAQLILTPEKQVRSYTLETADLTGDNGLTLSKDCFTLYNQKYHEVTKGSEGYSKGLGFYPDALLPMAQAVAYGENKIAGGDNQGITVSCRVPASQAAGVYSGSFNLTIDGKLQAVPVSMTVVDYTLSDANTAKSCFMTARWYLQQYGDSTLENYKRYCDYLISRRVMPMYLPALPEDVAAYTECAYEYGRRDDVSSFAVPFQEMYSNVYNDVDVNWNALYEMTKSIAKKSIETGVNLIAKSYYVFGMIDEAEMNKTEDRAARVCNDAYNLVNRLANELAADSTVTGENKAAVIASIRDLPCLETGKYTDRMHNDGNGVRNWCPLFADFDTPEKRAMYEAMDAETWWYGCIGPNNPYPTYQIDDDLISSRIVSWMQKDYNLAGNLYWETIYWDSVLDGDNKTDIYDSPMVFPGDNGDGYLMYPGDVYGISGPVGSIRLESIRDGMEEYEVLADVENKYRADGIGSDAILQSYYKKLYENAMVNTTSEAFMNVRKSMYQTAALSQNYDTFISGVTESAGKTVFEIKAGAGVTIRSGGTVLSGENVGNYKRYRVEVSRDGAVNAMEITAEKDGRSQTLRIGLGGKETLLTSMTEDGAKDYFTADKATLSVADGSTIDSGMDSRVLKADLQANENAQTVRFTHAGLSKLPDSGSLSFDVFNQGESVTFTMYMKCSGKPVLLPLGGRTLRGGLQKVTVVGLEKLAWKTYGDIEYLVFSFGSKNNGARTVYLDNISLQALEAAQ